MATGTLSDLAMADAEFGTALYYVREAVLAGGFLLYAALAPHMRLRSLAPAAANIAGAALAVLFALCTVALHASHEPAVRVAAALAVALLIGVTGGMVYERIALLAPRQAVPSEQPRDRRGDIARLLGCVVGIGGALAVVLQFVVQTAAWPEGLLDACLVIGFCLLILLARKTRPIPVRTGADAGNERRADTSGTTPVVCLVIATVCLFALLASYETAARAAGNLATFYEWHRLFLVVGYVAIGAAAFFGNLRAASVAMLVFALFTIIVLVQTVLKDSGPLTTVLFYTLLGAVIAWSSISFLSVAAQTKHPALVASMGRVIGAVVTLSEVLIQLTMGMPLMVVPTCSLIMLAVLVLALVKGGFLVSGVPSQTAEAPETNRDGRGRVSEGQLRTLALERGQTNREQEVLAALVLTEAKNQQIADDLGISRRQLQNHVCRIYEKTGVETRSGLVMLVCGDTQPR